MPPREVPREERPAGPLARALDGDAVVVLQIRNGVGLARLCLDALPAQRQGQLPREGIAELARGWVNDQNACLRHRPSSNGHCEDRAGESRHGPTPAAQLLRSPNVRAKGLRGDRSMAYRRSEVTAPVNPGGGPGAHSRRHRRRRARSPSPGRGGPRPRKHRG